MRCPHILIEHVAGMCFCGCVWCLCDCWWYLLFINLSVSECCVMEMHKMHVFGCVEVYSVFECLTGRFEAYRECVRMECVVVLIFVAWVSQCVPGSTSCYSLCV